MDVNIESVVLATCEECGVQAKIKVKASGTQEERPAIALDLSGSSSCSVSVPNQSA